MLDQSLQLVGTGSVWMSDNPMAFDGFYVGMLHPLLNINQEIPTVQFLFFRGFAQSHSKLIKTRIIVCGLEEIVFKEETNLNSEKVNLYYSTHRDPLPIPFSDFLAVEPAEGMLAEDCPIEYTLCSTLDCSEDTLDRKRWVYNESHIQLSRESYMPHTVVYVLAETRGSKFSRKEINATICVDTPPVNKYGKTL